MPKLADDAIREARLLIAEFDREIAETAKILRATKKENRPVVRLRGELSRLRRERAKAYSDLLDLLELAEMPPEFMGWA
jgi:hypothetical protein